MKTCSKCKLPQPISNFNKHHKSSDGYQWWCKNCKAEWGAKKKHRLGIARPMAEAKDIGMYLGVVIAERALSHVFTQVIKMPHGNPGFDFICGKGYKVDVKSGCLRTRTERDGYRRTRWKFHIGKNTIAQYFVCLGFDDRDSLEPLRMWIIPGKSVQHLDTICITNTPEALKKWEKYERSVDKVLVCCTEMRKTNALKEAGQE